MKLQYPLDLVKKDRQYSKRTQVSLSQMQYEKLMHEKGDKSLAEEVRTRLMHSWEVEARANRHKQALLDDVLEMLSTEEPDRSMDADTAVQYQKSLRQGRI
jgi:uncharacterized protein HemY